MCKNPSPTKLKCLAQMRPLQARNERDHKLDKRFANSEK